MGIPGKAAVNRRAFDSNFHTGEHIITLTCGVSCPRAPPDGLLFVPHQPEVIDAMKKLPSTPVPFAGAREAGEEMRADT